MNSMSRMFPWSAAVECRSGAQHAALIAIPCLVMLAGCRAGRWPQREGIIRPEGVYVLHLPGIVGDVGFDEDFADGLICGGVQDVELIDWTGPNPLGNLTSERIHQRGARMLVDRIEQLHLTIPEARLVVSAHSGGAEPVLLALERMKPGAVEQVWLLAPAVSRARPLEVAAGQTKRLVNVCSNGDWLFLGLGTSLIGTSDGPKADAAGRHGFSPHDAATLPANLEQWPYQHGWRKFDYHGGHISIMSGEFAQEVIAPSMLHWMPTGPPAD